MNISNPLKGDRIEFHILQSFPVTCLNRDDVGAPKTAIVGGTTRARVSSQCWKRQVRLEMRNLGVTCGNRTRLIDKLVRDACIKKGANEEQAENCGQKVSEVFIGESKNKNDTLVFLSPKEVDFLAERFKEVGFDLDLITKNKAKVKDKAKDKDDKKWLENLLKSIAPTDAVDIALFGRMVAKIVSMNVEAAASFSHAISTHTVSNEVEFFTALDDQPEGPGAAHMGSLEFNSATYYRYISLDLGQLWQTLAGQGVSKAVEAFTKALFLAIPNARQTTQSGASPWEFAKVFIRKGQRLQVPFETPVEKKKEGGFLEPSIDALKEYLDGKEKLSGSLFMKKAEYTLGDKQQKDHTIDGLLKFLDLEISKLEAK